MAGISRGILGGSFPAANATAQVAITFFFCCLGKFFVALQVWRGKGGSTLLSF